jgi:hypothetical protein
MDPQAALDYAEWSIKDARETIHAELRAEELREAREYLDSYSAWRSRGGFEPPGGDARHKRLVDALNQLGSGPLK